MGLHFIVRQGKCIQVYLACFLALGLGAYLGVSRRRRMKKVDKTQFYLLFEAILRIVWLGTIQLTIRKLRKGVHELGPK